MKMTFRWYGSKSDPIPLKYVKQIPGMTGLMGLLDKPAGVDWPEDEFKALVNEVHAAGLELEDFGDAQLTGKNGSAGYFRLDWFTPDGLRTWGDGRMFIQGTKGFIEVRKYVNLASEKNGGGHVFVVNDQGEKYLNAAGVTGYPFFGQLILDCLNRTENAMTQAHAFKAAELCLLAQEKAVRIAGL